MAPVVHSEAHDLGRPNHQRREVGRLERHALAVRPGRALLPALAREQLGDVGDAVEQDELVAVSPGRAGSPGGSDRGQPHEVAFLNARVAPVSVNAPTIAMIPNAFPSAAQL